MDPTAVGTILTIALVGGAGFSLATGTLVGRFGRRTTLILASLGMAASGLVLALAQHPVLFGFAALLGTLSPGGQEVGPFGAIEQAAIADDSSGNPTRRFATYNLVGSLAAAVGALAVTVIQSEPLLYAYSAAGIGLTAVYAATFGGHDVGSETWRTQRRPLRLPLGVAERLSLLFGFDALAGGFVVPELHRVLALGSFRRRSTCAGGVVFGTGVLSAVSFPIAAVLAERIGLLKTMVFTHLPSNVLLLLIPLMPTFPLAAVVLLARFALSQMDVPTRQAYMMALVSSNERPYAAGLSAAVRPAAAAVAPVLSGLAIQGAAFGLPFYVAGGLKIAYDLALFTSFRRVAPPATDEDEHGPASRRAPLN